MKYKFKDGGVVKLQNAWTTMPNPEDSIRRAWEIQAQREREAAFTDSLGYITQGDGKKRNALTRWAQDTAKGQEAVRALNTLKWAADKGLMLAGGNWLLKGLKAKKYLTTAGELIGGAAGAEGLNQAGKWVDDKLGTSNPFLDFQKLGTLSGVILGASGAKKSLQWAAGKGVNLPASNMEFNNLRTQYLNNTAGRAKIQTPNKGWENYSNYDVYENAFKNKPSVDLSEPITMDEAKASVSRWLGDRIQLGDPEILKGLQMAPSSTPETGYIDFYDTSKPMNKSLRKTFYAAPGGQGYSYGRPVTQGVMHRTVDGTEYLEYPRNSNIRYYLGKFKTEGKEPTLVHIGPPNMDGTVMKPRPDPLHRVDQDFLWWQRNNPFWSKGEITTRINDVVPSKSAIGSVNSDYPTRLTGAVDLADPKLNTVQMQYNPLTKTFGWMKYTVPKESGPTPQEAATTYHWDPRVKLLSRPISEAELEGTPKGERNQIIKETPLLQKRANEAIESRVQEPAIIKFWTESEIENELDPEIRSNMIYSRQKAIDNANEGKTYGHIIFGNSNVADAFNKNLQKYIDTLPDVELIPELRPSVFDEVELQSPTIKAYRDFLSHRGFHANDISNADLGKFLQHEYNKLLAQQTGKVRGKLLWHGSPVQFDNFSLDTIGEYTNNNGAIGPGIYFSSGGSPYGAYRSVVDYTLHVPNLQPYLIDGIKSTPEGHLMREKGIIPEYIGRSTGYTPEQVQAWMKEHPVSLDNTRLFVNPGPGGQGPYHGRVIPSEFMYRGNRIKSLFPDPSLLIEASDGTIQMTSRNFEPGKLNYKRGGTINNEKTQR